MTLGRLATSKVAGIALERRGRGQPLLLLHGTGGSRYHWTPVIDLLVPRRELLLVDLPGHGESDPPPAGIPLTARGYARQLAALLEELGLASVHVAGNSMGGWTALELAKLGRARSVVALAPAGLWRAHAPKSSILKLQGQYRLGRLCSPLLPRMLQTAYGRQLILGPVVAKPWQIPPAAAIEIVSTYIRTPTFQQHLAATRSERFHDGAAIHVPVTVAWGERERLIPERARLREELPAHTRYMTLPECGHLPMWDNPKLVAEMILDGTGSARMSDPREASPAGPTVE